MRLLQHYKLVDYLTQGYVALVGALVLLLHDDSLPSWPVHVLGHAVALVVVHGIVHLGSTRRGRLLRLLRTFYPIVLYTFFYTETHHLDGIVFAQPFDGLLIDWDQRVFGEQPCRTLMERFPSVFVSEALYLAYFSYYVMVIGVGVALYLVDRRQVCRYLTTVSLVFYVCYLTYILFPVMGPHGTQIGITFTGELASVGPRVAPESVQSGPFYHVMGLVYHLVEPTGGAAFPSSHVAVSVTTVAFTWKRLRRIRWVHLLATILLCISTVYCGYHYAADVFGGLLAAALLVPLASWLHRWCGSGADDETCTIDSDAPAGGAGVTATGS